MVAELVEQGLVKEVLNVFGIVESRRLGGGFGSFFLISRLSWVYACNRSPAQLIVGCDSEMTYP